MMTGKLETGDRVEVVYPPDVDGFKGTVERVTKKGARVRYDDDLRVYSVSREYIYKIVE